MSIFGANVNTISNLAVFHLSPVVGLTISNKYTNRHIILCTVPKDVDILYYEDVVQGKLFLKFLLGDLMNSNEEFDSSTEAEIIESSKNSFIISVTLA